MREPEGPGLPAARPEGAAAGARFEVRVEVDGRAVPLKAFLHDMLGAAVIGLVSGLRGVEAPASVRIDVRSR